MVVVDCFNHVHVDRERFNKDDDDDNDGKTEDDDNDGYVDDNVRRELLLCTNDNVLSKLDTSRRSTDKRKKES